MLSKKELSDYNIEISKQFYNCAIAYINSKDFCCGFTPYIINLCLACELVLKTILYDNGYGKDPKSIKKEKHNLFKLYNSLSSDIKDKIKNNLNNYQIDQELGKSENIFNAIRYYYLNALFGTPEAFETSPVFLKKFYEVLLDIYNEKKKI